MFRDAFTRLERDETDKILRAVNPALEGGGFDPEKATILSYALPFYPGYLLLDIADHSVAPAVQRIVIYREGEVTVMDGSNGPIYRLNASVPVRLDTGNVVDYVRFFYSSVRGRHGRFIISESVDDIAWREEPPPAARKAIGQTLSPLRIENVDAEGAFQLRAHMVFRDSLFGTRITVRPDGLVTMSEEELLIENMPVLDDTLGQ